MLPTQQISTEIPRYGEILSLYNITKRIIDFLFASVLLTASIPFFIIVCAIIYIETGCSPIYVQRRGITLEGKEFKIYKFRTLKKHTNSFKETAQIFLKENLSDWVTRSGSILRRTGLDELPQLVNILMGEMSFIGPRPLSHNDLILMKNQETTLYNRRSFIESKPGISGYWQIYGNRVKGVQNLIELEEFYEHNKTILFDFFLMLMTIPIILFAKHTDAIIGRKEK